MDSVLRTQVKMYMIAKSEILVIIPLDAKLIFFSLLRNPPSEWEKSPVPLKVRVLLQDQLLTWLCYVEPSSWLHVKSVLLYTTSSRNSRQLENHSRKRPRQHKATLQKHPKSFPLNKTLQKKWYFGLKSKEISILKFCVGKMQKIKSQKINLYNWIFF